MTRKNSRPPKKRNTQRKHELVQPKPRPTFNIEAIITKKVEVMVREYKGLEYKALAKTECALVGPGVSDAYTLCFVREKTAAEALKLRVGDRVLLGGAFFRQAPKGRGKTELHAKQFHLFCDLDNLEN
jgi:hypothetical protein